MNSLLLKPLLLEKHQSPLQLMLTHKKDLIPEIKNINLTKRIKYPTYYNKICMNPRVLLS